MMCPGIFDKMYDSLLCFAGTYSFEIGSLDHSGVYRVLAKTSTPEDLYINFQWFEKDLNTNHAYALIGNENAADSLNARIYVFDTLQE